MPAIDRSLSLIAGAIPEYDLGVAFTALQVERRRKPMMRAPKPTAATWRQPAPYGQTSRSMADHSAGEYASLRAVAHERQKKNARIAAER